MELSVRRAESASLMGFIMYEYGLENLFRLNNSFEPWPTAIETVFGVSPDDLEIKWLMFAQKESGQ
jgi:hypothetical protein